MNTRPDIVKRRHADLAACLLPWLIAVVFLWPLATPGIAQTEHDHGHEDETVTPQESSESVQTKCPVMSGNDIDPAIFSVYQGKKVYFCCQFCKTAFEKEPQKYLAGLPQFAGHVQHEGGPAAANVSGHGHSLAPSTGLALYKLIKPVGILTLLSLVTTVLMGVFRRKNPKLLFKWHKRMGVTTLLLALVHVVLIVIAH